MYKNKTLLLLILIFFLGYNSIYSNENEYVAIAIEDVSKENADKIAKTISYMLLEDGKSLDINKPLDKYHRTALMWAAVRCSSLEWIKVIVETRGADVNYTDLQGKTVLIHLALSGKIDKLKKKAIFEYLLTKTDNINIKDNFGYSLLFYTALYSPELLPLLIAKNIDLEIKNNGDVTILEHLANLHKYYLSLEFVPGGEMCMIPGKVGQLEQAIKILIEGGANCGFLYKNDFIQDNEMVYAKDRHGYSARIENNILSHFKLKANNELGFYFNQDIVNIINAYFLGELKREKAPTDEEINYKILSLLELTQKNDTKANKKTKKDEKK